MAKLSREQFNFSEDYQDLVLACVLRHSEFSKYSSILDPKMFSSVISTLIARKVFDYHKKFFIFPSREILHQLACDEAKKSGESEAAMTGYVERLFTIRIGGWKHVHERVIAFCRERAVVTALFRCKEFIQNGETPEGGFRKLFQDAVDTGSQFERPAIPLLEIAEAEIDPKETLLGDRWLCRGGSALEVGPSGVGKSSANIQMAVKWSVGRTAFGIKPAGPLKILIIQAENDDGDLKEMAAGVIGSSTKTMSKEEKELLPKNCLIFAEQATTGQEFIDQVLCPKLRKYRPDLVVIDPLLAFLGADPTNTEATAKFLRAGINPLLREYNCGLILTHHTPKASNRDTSKWKPSDWGYAGAGGADITNWARAILVIDATHDPRTFRFIAAKRGSRIGWVDRDTGEREIVRHYSHSAQDGVIAWMKSTPEDLVRVEQAKPDGVRRKPATEEEFLDLVPETGSIPKNDLIARASKARIGLNKARALLEELITEGKLFEHLEKRVGTNPKKLISRDEQAPE